jgi:hypothetical protein
MNQAYSISDTVVTSDTVKTLHASKPWSVLVPIKTHQLSFLENDAVIEPEKVAIDNMRVGVEFIISPSKENEKEKKTEVLPVFESYVFIDVDLQG